MAKPGESYFSVLTRAINDVAAKGYTSPEQIDAWSEELRKAAERSMRSISDVERMVRDGMAAIFRRQVENGGVLRLNPGVKAYTLDRVRPELHAELSRRIAASIDLIKLNRPQAVDKMEQRFRGWATSVPAGGSDTVARREEKSRVRKSLASLPYAERRVTIDQGHKLVAAINTTVAVNGGAIGAIWQSHASQPGYNGRPIHNARDGKFFLVKGSWADQAGYVKPGPEGYAEGVDQPAEWPYCFPGDSLIPYADGVTVGYRRLYTGELTEITTASGQTIRATPNHPIMTSRGWVPIHLLDEGDEVLEVRDNLILPVEPDDNDAIPTIAQIFGALEEIGVSGKCRATLEQFHGDGSNGDVDTVNSTWPLPFGSDLFRVDGDLQFGFTKALIETATIGTKNLFFLGYRRVFPNLTSLGRKLGAALRPFAIHSDVGGLATVSGVDTGGYQPVADHAACHPKLTRQGQNAVTAFKGFYDFFYRKFNFSRASFPVSPIESETPGLGVKRAGIDAHQFSDFRSRLPFATKTSNVVKVERSAWSGHVYNLETVDGWYVANNVIVSNCRCHWQYVFSLRSIPPECLTEKGKEALAEARKKAAAQR